MSGEVDAQANIHGPTQRTDDLVGAGFWIRALAQIIDIVVHFGAWLITAVVLIFAVGVYAGITNLAVEPLTDKLVAPTWYGYALAAIGFALYHALMEGACGASVGKRLLGLVAITSKGTPLRFTAALGRSFAFYVDSLFFGLIAYSSMMPPLQQRFGDKWCSTVVSRRSKTTFGADQSRTHFGSALLIGLLADAACYVASACIKLG